MRPQVARILRDLNHEDEDINTYAAMNILRLKQISEDEIAAIFPALRVATTHSSISVRFFSKKALNEIKLQMAKFPRFQAEHSKVQDGVRTASWIDLLATLRTAATDTKLAILDLLRDLDDPQIVPAMQAFIEQEEDVFVIAEAIKILGLIGTHQLIDDLTKFLKHDDSRIRSNAVEALEEIGGKEVVRSIIPLLEDDDNRVKGTVAKIVGIHGEHNVLATMASMLHSVEIWMRESATYALGFIPYAESVDLLLEACCDVNPDVQRKAIDSLGKLRASKAKSYLTTIAGSADGAVAQAAQDAVPKINKEPKEYPYYDEANRGRPLSGLEDRPQKGKGKDASKKGGDGEAPKTEDKANTGAAAKGRSAMRGALERLRLFRRKPKVDDEEIAALTSARDDMLEDVGKRAVALHRDQGIQRSYLPYFTNEVKKLRYLIEQKELQKKDMKEEARTSTFMSFLKESVSRFTQEKRVDQRMESLQRRLRNKHVELGLKLLDDAKEEELILLELKREKLRKLMHQIEILKAPPADELPETE